MRGRWKWARYRKSDRSERGNRVRGKSGGRMTRVAIMTGERRIG